MTEPHRPRVRASDEERERVAETLRGAMSEGRLNLAEGEDRLAQVYAATYRDELPPLVADLPNEQPPPSQPPPPHQRPRAIRAIPAVAWAVLAAVVTIAWALSSGRLWGPLLFAGIAAVMILKRGGRPRGGHCGWHGRRHEGDRTGGHPSVSFGR